MERERGEEEREKRGYFGSKEAAEIEMQLFFPGFSLPNQYWYHLGAHISVAILVAASGGVYIWVALLKKKP